MGPCVGISLGDSSFPSPPEPAGTLAMRQSRLYLEPDQCSCRGPCPGEAAAAGEPGLRVRDITLSLGLACHQLLDFRVVTWLTQPQVPHPWKLKVIITMTYSQAVTVEEFIYVEG